MSQAPSAKVPQLITVGLVVVGVVIALVSGPLGKIVGGGVAASGVLPSGWSAWLGIQQETQASMAISLVLGLAALGVGALLVVLGVVDWVR